jgi:hypothetical protein
MRQATLQPPERSGIIGRRQGTSRDAPGIPAFDLTHSIKEFVDEPFDQPSRLAAHFGRFRIGRWRGDAGWQQGGGSRERLPEFDHRQQQGPAGPGEPDDRRWPSDPAATGIVGVAHHRCAGDRWRVGGRLCGDRSQASRGGGVSGRTLRTLRRSLDGRAGAADPGPYRHGWQAGLPGHRRGDDAAFGQDGRRDHQPSPGPIRRSMRKRPST